MEYTGKILQQVVGYEKMRRKNANPPKDERRVHVCKCVYR